MSLSPPSPSASAPLHPPAHLWEAAAADTPPPPTAPPADALATEWLLTNGRGTFAMGTVAGVNTRRYHGLLVAATLPPVNRLNTVNAVNEILTFDGQTVELANHEFHAEQADGEVFHPQGFAYLKRFEKDTTCRWTYEAGPLRIIKTLRLAWRQDVAELSYRIEPAASPSAGKPLTPDRVTLSLHPLLAMRDFHHLRQPHEGGFEIDTGIDALHVYRDNTPPLTLSVDHGRFHAGPDWWHHFRRRVETARGQDDREELFCPGRFEHTFDQVGAAVCQMSLRFGFGDLDNAFPAPSAPDPRLNTLARHAGHVLSHCRNDETDDAPDDKTVTDLVAAANDFVVMRRLQSHEATTILAGYPWFADWGRDTMIALPGLMLCTGRYEEASDTLVTFARHIRHGLVPNRFDDYGGEPHYNTVDASLWFIHAALIYLQQTDDRKTWSRALAEACKQIIHAYQTGTENDIRMDSDGLITAGDPDTQLTWMDAKHGDTVFTPRHGKAVEINALWHHALAGCAAAFADSDPQLARRYADLSHQVKQSFNEVFWSDDLGHLIDHVDTAGHVDRSLRPNQVFAVSLAHSPLAQQRQQRLMNVVREKLLTPVGLRTLPPDDPAYHGRYGGSMFERDRAYHQGTVWAWLIGPYVEGWLRSHRFSAAARRHGREAIAGLIDQLNHHSLGQIHEIYSGDAPHAPDGCPAQAWSVAETLRAYLLVHSSK